MTQAYCYLRKPFKNEIAMYQHVWSWGINCGQRDAWTYGWSFWSSGYHSQLGLIYKD